MGGNVAVLSDITQPIIEDRQQTFIHPGLSIPNTRCVSSCHLVTPGLNSLWFLPDTQSLLVHMQCWFKLLWFIGWHFVFVDMIINSATCPVTFLASFMNYFETDRLLVWEWWNGKSFNCIIHVSACVQLCTTPMGHFCHLASIFIHWCFCFKLNT